MTTSAIAAVASRTATESNQLVKTAGGEYTAASVSAHPAQAAGLIKLKDGNYGAPIVAAADRYTEVAADLSTLKLGG